VVVHILAAVLSVVVISHTYKPVEVRGHPSVGTLTCIQKATKVETYRTAFPTSPPPRGTRTFTEWPGLKVVEQGPTQHGPFAIALSKLLGDPKTYSAIEWGGVASTSYLLRCNGPAGRVDVWLGLSDDLIRVLRYDRHGHVLESVQGSIIGSTGRFHALLRPVFPKDDELQPAATRPTLSPAK